jgi:hypothetical protein
VSTWSRFSGTPVLKKQASCLQHHLICDADVAPPRRSRNASGPLATSRRPPGPRSPFFQEKVGVWLPIIYHVPTSVSTRPSGTAANLYDQTHHPPASTLRGDSGSARSQTASLPVIQAETVRVETYRSPDRPCSLRPSETFVFQARSFTAIAKFNQAPIPRFGQAGVLAASK